MKQQKNYLNNKYHYEHNKLYCFFNISLIGFFIAFFTENFSAGGKISYLIWRFVLIGREEKREVFESERKKRALIKSDEGE